MILPLIGISQTEKDIDNNIYQTVTIGTQIWMKENLKVSHYNNGDSIPNVIESSDWTKLTTGAFCYYGNNVDNGKIYGNLYNYYCINDSRGLCPTGWHVPTNSDWIKLHNYANNNASKLMDTTIFGWKSFSLANNKSGFGALSGGDRGSEGDFHTIGSYGYWWSATEKEITDSWCMVLGYTGGFENDWIGWFSNNMKCGFSIRCISDQVYNDINVPKIDDTFLYPNPVMDKMYINSGNGDNLLLIYDMQGKQILSKFICSNFVDVSDLQSGIYTVKLINSRQIRINMMIKI